MFSSTFHIDWLTKRIKQKLKHANYKHMKTFNTMLCNCIKDKEVSVFHHDFSLPYHLLKRHLYFNEGNPVFKYFKITPFGKYITKNPRLNLYKEVEPIDNILDTYFTNTLRKYKTLETAFKINKEYILYVMQSPLTEHKKHTINLLKYARDNKVLIVFKAHPIPLEQVTAKETWKIFNQQGLVSEYSVLVEDVNIDSLIDNSEAVITCSSSVALVVMLKGKPTASLDDMDISEVLPKIEKLDDITNITAVDKQTIKQFMTWYLNYLSIDIYSKSATTRLQTKIDAYINHATDKDILML